MSERIDRAGALTWVLLAAGGIDLRVGPNFGTAVAANRADEQVC